MKKVFSKLVCLVLCMCMLSQTVYANTGNEDLALVTYVSDVKVIYAKDLDEAKKKVPKGYELYEKDINKGADSLGVYLCYTTTTEATNAITDIRLMNENGGFDRGTFNDKMDQALESLEVQAKGIYDAIVEEYIPNYKAGLPGAKYAHDQLNIFMFDKETRLGDYIAAGKLTTQDISKMLLVCHNTVISSILSLLAQGLQRKDGEDWLDKLEKMDPSQYEMNATLQREYADLINQMQAPLNDFSDQYNIMVYTDDVRDSMTAEQIDMYGEDLANEDVVNWWYTLWDILNAHPLAGDSGLTAESVLVEFYLGESVANHKICMLIDAMTKGQRVMLSLVGPINFILSDLFTEEERIKAEEGLAELKAENGTISVWAGIDSDIFDSEVGITSVAYDEMVTSNNYDIFTDEQRVLTKSAQDYIALVTNYSSIVFSVLSILSGAAMLAKGYTGTIAAIKLLAKIGLFLAKGLVATIASYAPMVVLGLCLLASLIVWIIQEIQAGKPPEHDRTTIPKYMVDSIVDNNGAQRYEIYQRVENVQSNSALKKESDYGLGGVHNLNGSDVNANKGYHWAALYVTKSEAAGNPIEADFFVSTTLDIAPDGYIPLRHFNKKSEVVNLNAVDSYSGEDKELYLYYKGTRLDENHSVYKYIRNLAVVNVSLREPLNPDKYRFNADEAFAIAQKELTEMGMYPINYNFSDDPDEVVLIGWNGTDNEEYAVKDIRFVYRSSVGRAGGGVYGSLNYGNIGTINDWSLFICRGEQSPAPAITMLKLVERGVDPSTTEGISINANGKDSTLDTNDQTDYGIGWEPVNEFTGGIAIPKGKQGAQLYFMPETTFTEGPDYLAGIKFDAYIYNYSYTLSGTHLTSYVEDCKHVDIWNNDPELYREYKEAAYGEFFFEDSFMMTKRYFSLLGGGIHGNSGNPDCEYIDKNGYTSEERKQPHTASAIKYYLTKNPYRAIYGVATRVAADLQMRDSFVTYAQYGYAISPTELTISLPNVEIEAFQYRDLLESGKEYKDKVTILEDDPYHNEEGIVVNFDITQTCMGKDYITWNNIYVMGYTEDKTPLTTSDILFSKESLNESEYPDTFIPVPYMGGDGTQYSVMSPLDETVEAFVESQAKKLQVGLFSTFFGYVRSEIKVDDMTTTYNPGTGKYISNLFLSSKENIRVTSLLNNDKDAECKDVTYRQLETQLLFAGATTIFTKNIGTDYYSGGNDNANTVYLGYSRSDDPEDAIRDIRFYVCDKGEKPPKTLDVKMEINGKEQTVKYMLVDDISLTSKANLDCKKVLNGKGMEVWEQTELYKERQAYLYITRNSIAFPDPITDMQATTWCSFGTYDPLLSVDGESFYTVKKQSNVNLHIKDKWFDEGYSISFKRESNNELYVSEITVKNGGNKNQVITDLIDQGYSVVNKDMNQRAAGDHIYIGLKYTANKDEAITNVLARHKKNPAQSYSVTDENHQYHLCAKVDLNKGAGGDYIYLYYTKDTRAGEPLLDLYGAGGIKDFSDSQYQHSTVQRFTDFKYSNLNAGTTAFTADIYLVMKRPTTSGKYISSIGVEYGWSKSGAIEKLQKKGYTEYIDKNLNAGTGSSQYVYIGYKRTDDPNEAIRDILFFTYKSDNPKESHDISYKMASSVNLNRHCNINALDIFLYYSKDKNAGDPITALYCTDKPVEGLKNELGYHRTATAANMGGYLDLNKLAYGDYIYLVIVSQPIPRMVGSIFSSGSWVAILGLASLMGVASTGVVLYYRRKKRKNSSVA